MTTGNYLYYMNYREQILEYVLKEKVMVISGHTGCGKTTQVPQFILNYYMKEKMPVNILVTQPRKIAAKSIAEVNSYIINML